MNICIRDAITKLPGRALFPVLATLASSLQSQAAPVVTEHGPFGEANGLNEAQMIALRPVGIGDLLESATGSFASGGPKFGGQLTTLTDGLAVPTPGPFYASNGSQVEYILGSTIDLARIDFAMFADWQRTSAWVDVETSTDGGANWTLLHEVRQVEQNGGSVDREYNAHSLTDDTGSLAAGINAIRFTFLGDGMGSDESGYVEIDAYRVESLDIADTGPQAITPLPATNAEVLAIQPVGRGDLLESATRNFNGTLLFGGQEKNVNDGVAISNGGDTDSTTNVFSASDGSTLEFILDGTYDIDQIDVFTLGDVDRTGHVYDVEISTDGGVSYSALTSVNLPDSGGGDRHIRGVSLTDAGGNLANGVSAIRFTFFDDGAGSAESVFAEIDALGTLVGPPPLIVDVADTGNLVIPEGSAATNTDVIAVQPVGTDDILETGTQSQKLSSGNLLFGSELKNINDGLAISNGGTAGSANNLFSVSNGSQLDFLLIGTFDITQIDVYTFWDPGRTGQAYTISTSSDGGNTFQPLTSVSLPDSGADDRVIRSINLTTATGNLAEGINAIRFTIENDGAGDPESVFAEIDVFGTLVSLYTGPIVIEHGPFGEVGNFTNEQVIALHPVGIGDVLELPSTTRSLVSGAMKFGGLEENINDGLAVDAGGAFFYVENGSQLEFQLGAKIDMAQIDFFTYADWQRTSIWVDVEVSSDGGSNWTLLHEVRVAESNGGSVDRDYNAASLTHTTGTLAAGINAIRFTFLGDGMGGDESGYAEIDVYAGDSRKLRLAVERSGSDLLLRWESKAGRLYNLRSEADAPVISTVDSIDWMIYENGVDLRFENIEATPPENTLTIPLPADAERLFVIEEFPVPPATVFSDDFEGGQGAWTAGGDIGLDPFTNWEFGAPTVVGPAAANSGSNCFGTNLSADYAFNADLWLRSPVIDLTAAAGATLNFSHYVDIEAGFDFGQIRLLDTDAANAELAILEMTIDGDNPADWKPFSKVLPAAALGKNIVIEFRFVADDVAPFPQVGWYIDDVIVTEP